MDRSLLAVGSPAWSGPRSPARGFGVCLALSLLAAGSGSVGAEPAPAPRRLAVLATESGGDVAACRVEVLGDPGTVERIELDAMGTLAAASDGFSLEARLDGACEARGDLVARAFRGGRLLDTAAWSPCRPVAPSQLRLQLPGGERLVGTARVGLEMTLGPGRDLRRVELVWRETPVALPGVEPLAAEIDFGDGESGVLRATAVLDDGSLLEDAVLVNGSGFAEAVTVQSRDLVVAATENGHPLRSPHAEDFAVIEGERPLQARAVIRAEDLPLAIALVVDASQSRSPAFHANLASVLAQLEEALAGQTVTVDVVAFKDRPALLLEGASRVTDALPAIRRLVPGGATAFYDALLFAGLQLQTARGRRAVVAITDGQDTVSRASVGFAIDWLRRLGVPVHVVAPGFWQKATRSELRMRAALVPDATAGATLFPGREKTWREVFREVAGRLGDQLVVTYDSPGGEPTAVEYRGEGRRVRLVLLAGARACGSR